RIGCAIITGKHYHNFLQVVEEMFNDNAIIKISNSEELVLELKELFMNDDKRNSLISASLIHANSKNGAIVKIIDELKNYNLLRIL
ncbi:MAG: hypothetical protein WCJ33_02205, partial [Pseudomonadota bacterium]